MTSDIQHPFNPPAPGLTDHSQKLKADFKQKPDLKEGIEIIHKVTTPVMEKEITDKLIELYNTHKDERGKLSDDRMSKVAGGMKQFADQKYGKAWQVVVLCGYYALSYSHEPYMSIQFASGEYICLIWQSHKVK